jgi:uncharacterized protein YdeI (YjbR/CyaY-like superfamily)
MGKRDPRVDAYIAKSADFARPILTALRETVHAACPDVEETMKWSFPHFMYQGMLCSMAAFKQHAVFGFWKGSLIVPDDAKIGGKKSESGMGQFGRITKPSDLPAKKTLIGYVHKAMALNEQGITVPRPVKRRGPMPVRVPPDLAAALKRSAKARATFDSFSPSHKRDYVDWITEARAKETRVRRLQTAVEWMAQGKSRNWKYER